jgi:Cytochrome C'
MKTRVSFIAIITLALLSSVACSSKSTAPTATTAAPATTSFKPVASVIDLMASQVDPAADFLWESVATISTEKGIEERQPRTDAEWAAVRHKALMVIEAANLLQMDGRVVAHPGQVLSEPAGMGDLTPEQSQAAVNADRATFNAYARAMQNTAEAMLASIEKRDPEGMLETGGPLDENCEECHRKFWYPDAPLPPGVAESPDAAAK